MKKEKAPELLIRGGRVVDPASGIDGYMDVLLADGRVAAIAKPGELSRKGAKEIVAAGLVVAPGLIDIHVHLREPGQQHKETIASGTAAAAAGGFTSVCAMPNTSPVNDNVELTRWMQQPERGATVNVFPIAAATVGSAGERLTDYAALKKAGAVAVTDDGRPILEEKMMEECLRVAARLKLAVIQHAEDTRLTAGCTMNLGPNSFKMGLRGMPVESESRIVERDIALAKKTRGHLHVAHLSTAAALDAVRRARRAGVHVTCEVTPHHLEFTDDAVRGYDTNCKMNPPLRSVADRNALRQGLLDGSVDCIASDHAPHALHEKQQEFDRAPFGITGLETTLPLTLEHTRRDIARTVLLLSANPARVLSLGGRGTLKNGSVADVTIFDPDAEWTFTAEESKSRSKNSPFLGRRFFGRAVMTIVGGRIVHQV